VYICACVREIVTWSFMQLRRVTMPTDLLSSIHFSLIRPGVSEFDDVVHLTSYVRMCNRIYAFSHVRDYLFLHTDHDALSRS